MELITRIEYRTSWGQNLFLRSGDRLYPLEYTEGDIWTGTVSGLKPGKPFEYRYEVHQEGVCIRSEWESHRIVTGEETAGNGSEIHYWSKTRLEVRDSWLDVPEGLPLQSAPFRSGVFSLVPGKVWKAAGTAVPVFSLRSEKSFGVGEFNDLKLLVDWAAATAQKVIQLLPVNDTTMTGTWEDSYPYNANSSFALHPQFMHLPDAGVVEDEEYLRLRDELNALLQVDYERVNREKIRLLRKAFKKTWKRVSGTKAYRKFVEENAPWLLPYAAWCMLRDDFGTADFSLWKSDKGDFRTHKPEKVREYVSAGQNESDFWCFVQYHLHQQLSALLRVSNQM